MRFWKRLVLSTIAALTVNSYAQSIDGLIANSQQLQVQLTLDRSTYFPGESSTITIVITNPTPGALQVLAPFSTSTGALCLFAQPPNGPLTPISADGPCHGPFSGTAFPTITMAAGAQQQVTLSSYGNMFDSGLPALQIPLQPSGYVLSYIYPGGAQAPFTVAAPHLDASTIVQAQNESSIDQASGTLLQGPSFIHAFALRSNNQSSICVSVAPTGIATPVSADSSGNFTGANGLFFKRIATSQNPITSISASVDNSGNVTVQWLDSTGARSDATSQVQYNLSLDVQPDGAGWVVPATSYYTPGATASLTALPSPGYAFLNWTGASVANPNSATTTVAMTNEYDLIANFTAISPVPGPANVSNQVRVTTSNTAFNSGSILESITVTNSSSQYITGPISVVLNNLSAGFTLTNANGTYNGSPYIRLVNYGFLGPGQSYTAFLQFSVGPTAIIPFTPTIYTGL